MTGPATRTYACHNGDHDICRGYTDGYETWRCPCPCHDVPRSDEEPAEAGD